MANTTVLGIVERLRQGSSRIKSVEFGGNMKQWKWRIKMEKSIDMQWKLGVRRGYRDVC